MEIDEDDESYPEACAICGGCLEDGWCPWCAEVAEDEARWENEEIEEP